MAKKLLKKIALAATATALTLNLAWNLLPNYTKHKVTNPFSHNSFMIGYNNQIFEYDKELGFKFPKGKLITITGFSTLEEILRNSNNYQCIILNLGDSSTSGWNSDNAYKGQINPHAVFFTYKTYSDILQEQSPCLVINAGVPGYTSFQGKQYLEKLLQNISAKKKKVNHVTIYFGNNDSTNNNNNDLTTCEDKVKLKNAKPSTNNSKGYRVTVKDYKQNIKDLITTAKKHGAKPIIIKPLIHYDWEPGIRSPQHQTEFKRALQSLKDPHAKKDLITARAEYKKGNYKLATELDRVLPRIKQKYLFALDRVAKETNTPIIDIQYKIPKTNNSNYFLDYCHPLPLTNDLLAKEIIKLINNQ